MFFKKKVQENISNLFCVLVTTAQHITGPHKFWADKGYTYIIFLSPTCRGEVGYF